MSKRRLKLTPKLSYKTQELVLRKQLVNFTEDIYKSFMYFSLQAYKGNDRRIQDASASTQVKKELNALLKVWEKKASAYAKKLALGLETRSDKYVRQKYAIMGIKFKVDSKELKELMKARYYENIRLIKTIPQKMFDDFSASYYNLIVEGDRTALIHKLGTIKGVSLRRARIIARDQTGKMIEDINQGRATQLGLEYYMWETVEDERVSKGKGGHKQLNGLIFRYDTPEAIIDSYNNKGHPKQRPLCRCIARSLFLEDGMKAVKIGYGYKIVDELTGQVVDV